MSWRLTAGRSSVALGRTRVWGPSGSGCPSRRHSTEGVGSPDTVQCSSTCCPACTATARGVTITVGAPGWGEGCSQCHSILVVLGLFLRHQR